MANKIHSRYSNYTSHAPHLQNNDASSKLETTVHLMCILVSYELNFFFSTNYYVSSSVY